MEETKIINGARVTASWSATDYLDAYVLPITQVYGVCFDQDGQILILHNPKTGSLTLPGGKPESGESIFETLVREVREEAGAELGATGVIGYQKISYPNNPNIREGDTFYQIRCAANVHIIDESTMDPSDHIVYKRIWVTSDEAKMR